MNLGSQILAPVSKPNAYQIPKKNLRWMMYHWVIHNPLCVHMTPPVPRLHAMEKCILIAANKNSKMIWIGFAHRWWWRGGSRCSMRRWHESREVWLVELKAIRKSQRIKVTRRRRWLRVLVTGRLYLLVRSKLSMENKRLTKHRQLAYDQTCHSFRRIKMHWHQSNKGDHSKWINFYILIDNNRRKGDLENPKVPIGVVQKALLVVGSETEEDLI